MSIRFWRNLRNLLILVAVLGIGSWFLLLRDVAQPKSNDPAHVFNHGSIGNEATHGIPYWIWRVLPSTFPEYLPGARRGWSAIGVAWRSGEPLPIGFSQKRRGAINTVSPNCAFCHQGTYRLAPNDPETIVHAGAGTRVDVGAYIDFLTKVAADNRFSASTIMPEIKARYDMPLWERLTYRYLLIPLGRMELQRQAKEFAWMASRPDWGVGRVDPMNPVKLRQLGMMDDGTIGTADIMPLWNLSAADATAQRRFAFTWDGSSVDLHQSVEAAAVADGLVSMGLKNAADNLDTITQFIRHTQPPASPFSPELDPADAYYVEPGKVQRGAEVFAENCADCHSTDGSRFRSPVPMAELGTDRHRLDAFTGPMLEEISAYSEGINWGFDYFEKTQGYIPTDLSGLWLRGPYLHNGSVPNLRAMLMPPGKRPGVFWRGSDLVDTENGGFVSSENGDPLRRMTKVTVDKAGNANSGHLWGTGLWTADKEALLAYLKTL